MKILQLHFKNINSLAGERHLDFTEPQFTDNGIFVITGKTGSGKTSILDAITLALYGRTPRVVVTSTSNDVMTYNTHDCYARVTFEINNKTYIADWRHERSKRGKFKSIQRQITDDGGNILAEQPKQCDLLIVDIIGLRFDQFTKVIMLAQGSFAAFLQSDKKDKGELLEQITGTAIYSEISQKVFERTKSEKENLERLIIDVEAVKLLSDDEIKALQDDLTSLNTQKTAHEKELIEIDTALKWQNDTQSLQKQIADLQQQTPELEKKVEHFTTETDKVSTDLKALKTSLAEAEPLWVKVRELDTKIIEQNNILAPITKAIETFEKQKADLNTSINILKEKLETTQGIPPKEQNDKQIADANNSIDNIDKQIDLLNQNIQLQKTIMSLTDHRNELKEGKPCPLCGSTTHPYATGVENQINQHEADLKALQSQKKEQKDIIATATNNNKILDASRNTEMEIALKTKELENIEQNISQKVNESTSTQNLRKDLIEQRKALFSNKSVNTEEAKLKQAIAYAEKSKENIEKQLNEAITNEKNNQTLINDKQNSLNKLIEQPPQYSHNPQLSTQHTQTKVAINQINQNIGAITQTLQTNEKNKTENQQKQEQKTIQDAITQKWSQLNDLIGSSDGKKYRNHAQTLTFEQLLTLANRQLGKMSDRYRLIHSQDTQTPFDLAVIDYFQNNEQRTAQNLSGGEKFIVSLSLALGLANMAGRNMRIDTMFIDEGFGTLDSENLDTALTTLSSLQNEGKLIGVISHLSELKDRIPTHISVTAQ